MRIKSLFHSVLLIAICNFIHTGIFCQMNLYSYQHPIPFLPETYTCQRTNETIFIDGKAHEESWQKAAWTESFVDIEGALKPEPYLGTRVKMLWDDSFFYFFAEMEDPHVWATLTQRDAVMFLDDDFEIFIDPDGDGHTYYEFEWNAFNTVWDLLLVRPYRLYEIPQAVDYYNVPELKSAVHIQGTLNDVHDVDKGWSIEIAIPFEALIELNEPVTIPNEGEVWRVNFSRVDWDMEIQGSSYKKMVDPISGKSLPEHNWVWSPTGYINMHMPEQWGYVRFIDDSSTDKKFDLPVDELIKWGLWQVYWQQMTDYRANKKFTDVLELYTIPSVHSLSFNPQIYVTPFSFEIVHVDSKNEGYWVLDKEGRMYHTASRKLK